MKIRHLAISFLLVSSLFAIPPGLTPHFGKVTENGSIQYAPLRIPLGNIVNGVAHPNCIWTSHGTTNQYAVLGWLPIDRMPPARPGFEAVATNVWTTTNGIVTPVWTWRALPPKVRTFSKLKVVLLLQERGLWTEARAWIDEQGLTDLYLAAQVFSDDNPFFAQGLDALKARFNLSDADVEAILSAVEIKQ